MQHIKRDWMKHFPLLKPIPRLKLLMKLDIMLVGIEFQTGRFLTFYRPNIYIESLSDDRYILRSNLIIDPKRKRELMICYDRCDAMSTDEAAELAKKDFGKVLGENVYVDDIFRMVDYSIRYNPVPESFLGKLGPIGIMITLARYFNDEDLTEYVKKKVHNILFPLSNSHIYNIFKMSKDELEQHHYDRIGTRDEIIQRVEVNSQDEKIKSLYRANLIFDKSRFDFTDADMSTFQRFKIIAQKAWRARPWRYWRIFH